MTRSPAAAVESLENRRLLATTPITFGSTLNDGVFAALTLEDGSRILAGIFGGMVDFDPGPGERLLTSNGQSDIFLARYTVRDKLVWAGRIGSGGGRIDNPPEFGPVQASVVDFINRAGPTTDLLGEYIGNIKPAGNDTFVLTGAFQSTADFDPSGVGVFNVRSAGYHDGFIVLLGFDGTFHGVTTIAGPFNDMVKDVAVVPGSGSVAGQAQVVATGYFTRSADFNPTSVVNLARADGRDDLFVARYRFDTDRPLARLVWQYTAGGDATDRRERDTGEALVLDADENVYVTGSFAGRADFDPSEAKLRFKAIDKTDGMLLVLSSRGKFHSLQSFGGQEFDVGNLLAFAPDGQSLYLAGAFSEEADLDLTDNEAIFVARKDGDAFDTDDDDEGRDEFDFFLQRLDLDGTPQWIQQIGGDDYENLLRMATTADGVVLSGSFAGRIEFDGPGGSAQSVSVRGDGDFDDDRDRESSYDAFVAQYAADGAFVGAAKFGGNGDDWGTALAVDAARGTATLAGLFRNTANFGLDGGSPRRRSAGLQDGFSLIVDLDPDVSSGAPA